MLNRKYTVVFVFLWLGALVWIGINSMISRQAASRLISQTPEYRCISAADSGHVFIRWSNLKNLRVPNTGFRVGTLSERGGDCILDGNAVSYVMLPTSSDNVLSLVRIAGDTVKAQFRQRGQLADVTDTTGSQRWRIDGDGYRKVAP
jgi:hypothetical protein